MSGRCGRAAKSGRNLAGWEVRPERGVAFAVAFHGIHAPEKKHVTIPQATHVVLFEKQRAKFFEEIEAFLRGPAAH